VPAGRDRADGSRHRPNTFPGAKSDGQRRWKALSIMGRSVVDLCRLSMALGIARTRRKHHKIKLFRENQGSCDGTGNTAPPEEFTSFGKPLEKT